MLAKRVKVEGKEEGRIEMCYGHVKKGKKQEKKEKERKRKSLILSLSRLQSSENRVCARRNVFPMQGGQGEGLFCSLSGSLTNTRRGTQKGTRDCQPGTKHSAREPGSLGATVEKRLQSPICTSLACPTKICPMSRDSLPPWKLNS